VPELNDRTDEELIRCGDTLHARACSTQRELLRVIAEVDRRDAWQDSGARDMAHWVCMRYGISYWKALRWVKAAHALEELPRLSNAFAHGELSIDKVVELTRFATQETEGHLIVWAQGVSCGAIREKGDLFHRSLQEAQEAEQARSLSWWFFAENSRFGMSVEMPAAEGAVVVKALERQARQLPVMPGEDGEWAADARLADALVAVCSARIAADADPDRATVVIHARLDRPGDELGSCEIEGGPAIHPEVARRFACNGRIQTVVEDESGIPVRVGRISREPPDWMLRQLRYRDRECTFPGCGGRQFTHAHHIEWWENGGQTDLDNLVLVCSFHHKLVHEYGWRLDRDRIGTVRWFQPEGTMYRAGPAPPEETFEQWSELLPLG
jgi:hypothetical protein